MEEEKVIISRERLEELEQMEHRLKEERRKFKESAKYAIKVCSSNFFPCELTVHTNDRIIAQINKEKEIAVNLLKKHCEELDSFNKLPLWKKILIVWNGKLTASH